MNRNQREQFVTLILAVVLIAGFALGLALPRFKKLESINEQNVWLVQDTHKLTAQNQAIDQIALEVEGLKEELKTVRRRIPPDDQFAQYENGLLRLGEQHGLWDADTEPKIIATATDSSVPDTQIKVKAMKLVFDSGFGEFYSFLSALEAQERLTHIQALDIQPSSTAGLLRISLELNIYYGSL